MNLTLSDQQKMQALADVYEFQEGSNPRQSFASIDLGFKMLGIEISDQSIVLQFKGNSEIRLYDYHEQDCCEWVYASWSYLKDFVVAASPKWETFQTLELCGVEKSGILLRFIGVDNNTSFFVPCYNEQNGYYSSDLKIFVNEEPYDVSCFVKDEIDP